MPKKLLQGITVHLCDTPLSISVSFVYEAYKPAKLAAEADDCHPEEPEEISVCRITDDKENLKGLTWLYYNSTTFAAEVDKQIIEALNNN